MFTLGTAGHIDHGKTTLCRELTGIDTDRLEEEKRRGISIELGFAHLLTPRGRHLGVVDVPGHERFIRTMVAGVSGIDAFLFVVAADEGIMPQTREHFDILRIMGVERGLIVLSKCDVADEDMRGVVKEELRSFLAGTPHATLPVLETAKGDGASYERLRVAIDGLLDGLTARRETGHFRLPVDRSFSMTGHGTVVTGTVAAGTVRRGDAVELLPEGLTSRVRAIQAYGAEAPEAVAGQRAALNLPDVAATLIGRGTCACTPGVFSPTSMIDCSLELLRGLPKGFQVLKNGSRLRFYLGTTEAIGRLYLLDRDALGEGSSCVAQFRLEHPIVAARGDRFLARTFSPLYTIGGGTVLDAAPRKHKGKSLGQAELERMAESDPRELVLKTLDEDPLVYLSLEDLARRLTLPEAQLEGLVPPAVEHAGILRVEASPQPLYCSEERQLRERRRLLSLLEEFHRAQPAVAGMAKASLQQAYSRTIRVDGFNLLLQQLFDSRDVLKRGALLARAGFEPKLDEALSKGLQEARRALARPDELAFGVKALGEACGLEQKLLSKVIGLLLNSGELTRLPGENFALAARVVELRERVVAHIRGAGGAADTNDLKNLLGLSRKHLIPFLEHLDETGVTLRSGNARRLRSG